MSDETGPTRMEPPVGARPATGKPGAEGDAESAARPPAPAGDAPTPALPEDVGWPAPGEPCA